MTQVLKIEFQMDGIEITRILDMDTKKEVFYGCDYDEVPEDEIQKMIEVNEGIVAAGPDFKHSVKLTPNLTHRSLKKRKTSRRSLNDLDDDDDSTPTPQDRSLDISARSRIERGQKLVTSLRAEISLLKLERQKVKDELEAKRRNLKKVNVELKSRLVLLGKYDQSIKKRGRRMGGAKLREELGILDGELEKEPVVKRGRGRPRKYSLHAENQQEGGSPPKVSDSAAKKKKTPLKEKDLNRGSSLRVCLEKVESDVLEKVVPKEENISKIVLKKEDDVSKAVVKKEENVVQDVAAGPMSPIRRSNRQMRCSEKLAAMIEMAPKLDDQSVVVRKILNEGDLLEEKVTEKKVKQKRKVDAAAKNDSPPLKVRNVKKGGK